MSDATLLARVEKLLAVHRAVPKKMMGSTCFMVGGNMCCGVKPASLMVRVGQDGYRAALAEPHVRPLEFGGRRPSGFVVVDAAGVETDKALRRWIERALAFTATLPPKRKAATKRPAARQKRG